MYFAEKGGRGEGDRTQAISGDRVHPVIRRKVRAPQKLPIKRFVVVQFGVAQCLLDGGNPQQL